jgi:hypothetical protein
MVVGFGTYEERGHSLAVFARATDRPTDRRTTTRFTTDVVVVHAIIIRACSS